MDIEIDFNPTPSTHYFVSVGINDHEAISFDNTTKGFRVIKQVLTNDKQTESDDPAKEISGEWDAIVLKDGKFVKKYHVQWRDEDKTDVVNGETWETIWERPIPEDTHKRLLYYSRFVSDNYEKLDNFPKEMVEFENFLSREAAKYQSLDVC